MLLEDHADGLPDEHLGRRAADQVGGQAQLRLLLDLDDRDHVGRRKAGDPGVVVDGEGRHARAARDRVHLEVAPQAARAEWLRRMQQVAAGAAAQELEAALATAAPEVLVLRGSRRGVKPLCIACLNI